MSAKTKSEETFERYLDCQSLTWSRIPSSDRKQPDYTLQHGDTICVFEVKEFDDPGVNSREGFSPCPPIQEKINRARRQFREYRQYCCALVLWNSKSVYRTTQPEVVLSAAFGKYVGTKPAHRDDLGANPPTYDFHGAAELTPAQNTTISALVVLTPYKLNHVWLEVWQRLSAKKQRGEKIEPWDQFELVEQVSLEQGTKYSYDGTIRVIVLENPYARVPFPVNLFVGPFDQRWRLESGRFRLVFLGSELERLRRDGVPFLYL